MYRYKFLVISIFVVLSANVSAFYGGSTAGPMKSCKPPELKQFTPAHLSVVAPQSEFSFMASKKTSPGSIEVSAKKQAVEVSVNETEEGFIVSGKLPSSLNNTYARIEIKATSITGCKGNNGWLLNIREQEKLSSTHTPPTLSEN